MCVCVCVCVMDKLPSKLRKNENDPNISFSESYLLKFYENIFKYYK